MSNTFGIDLGTCNVKVFCKATGKVLNEKNTIAIVNKNQMYAYGDQAYAMYEKDVYKRQALNKLYELQNKIKNRW